MMTTEQGKVTAARSKDIPLEAVRGIAALVVVLTHSVIGFLPKYAGMDFGNIGARLQGSVLFIAINGSSAVSLFFVLSGYILTRRYCATGDARILLKGAVKRWPRLMGPVFVAVLFSYALFYFHLYFFQEAGTASNSPWLVQFAGAFNQIGGPNATPLSIHLRDALLQGSFLVFFRGDWLYDSSLWTMHPELMGSFIAFGLAPILLEAGRSSRALVIALLIVAIAALFFARADLAAFPLGVGLAVLLPRGASLPARYAYPALLAAVYLLGYPGFAAGSYAIFGVLDAHGMPPTWPQIAGAAIVIGVIETFPPIRKPLSGRFSAFIGALSFPIYLLHALIICSVGSKVYLMAGPIAAIASVFVASTVASLPLMKFNDWWVGRVNAVADIVVRSGGPVGKTPNMGSPATTEAGRRPLPGLAAPVS
jgi:peptidoglycan/LPS O-acetylase OafA/YrhL